MISRQTQRVSVAAHARPEVGLSQLSPEQQACAAEQSWPALEHDPPG
jgi:hypothetical protein